MGGYFLLDASFLLANATGGDLPTFESAGIGFRIAGVPIPEPRVACLFCAAAMAFLGSRRRSRPG